MSTSTAGWRSRRGRWRLLLVLLVSVASIVLLVGCRTLGYYAHVGRGHAELMARRQPIADLVADPQTDPQLRRQLLPVLRAREFASAHLQLPRNRSYTLFTALDRPFVSWNVFAAPEFSVEPVLHCFPIAGCVGYRGFFDKTRAEAEAQRLSALGHETWIGGVRAYSTLGWFNDPVLSSMPLDRPDELVGTIFHELAHQKLYVPGDTAFNESFATFVQQQGLREWREREGLVAADSGRSDYRPVIERILALRTRLAEVYRRPLDVTRMRDAKRAEIEAFRDDYRRWRRGEGADRPAYDGWVEAPIDNAKLVPFGLYDQWLPAFEQLHADAGRDWGEFHRRVEALARLLPAARRQALLDLHARAQTRHAG